MGNLKVCREKTLPITIEGWDAGDSGDIVYSGVTWLEDFGPFRKGSQYEYLFLSIGKGYLECGNASPDSISRVEIIFQPVKKAET